MFFLRTKGVLMVENLQNAVCENNQLFSVLRRRKTEKDPWKVRKINTFPTCNGSINDH